MKRVQWTKRRWLLLVGTVVLFFLFGNLFRDYWLIRKVKLTGKPVSVRVLAKKRGYMKTPATVSVLYKGCETVLETRDKKFFRQSKVGETAIVLKRDDNGLLVPPEEPTTGALLLIICGFGLTIAQFCYLFKDNVW